jgi:hypothetical protein
LRGNPWLCPGVGQRGARPSHERRRIFNIRHEIRFINDAAVDDFAAGAEGLKARDYVETYSSGAGGRARLAW